MVRNKNVREEDSRKKIGLIYKWEKDSFHHIAFQSKVWFLEEFGEDFQDVLITLLSLLD